MVRKKPCQRNLFLPAYSRGCSFTEKNDFIKIINPAEKSPTEDLSRWRKIIHTNIHFHEEPMKYFAPPCILSLAIAVMFFGEVCFSQKKNHSASDDMSSEGQYKIHFKKADYLLGKFDFEESLKECKEALKFKSDDFFIRAMMCLDYYEIARKT